jgi:hypothetical protein
MQAFKDNEGRSWSVSINVSSVKRIRDLVKVDLLALGDKDAQLLKRLATDPVVLVDVLYAACKPEADARNITDEMFGQAMGGEAIDRATTALMQEIADFFPSHQREPMNAALVKMNQGLAIVTQKALAKVASLDMAKLLADIGDSSTKSPAESE